jgi:hypothetical protein
METIENFNLVRPSTVGVEKDRKVFVTQLNER